MRAVAIFSILIAFRLFNEVWSNTMVIGSYFGEKGSGPYYTAVLVFTALTLAYTLKGGMRSALMTDMVQMGLFSLLLVIILGVSPVANRATSVNWFSRASGNSTARLEPAFCGPDPGLQLPFSRSGAD